MKNDIRTIEEKCTESHRTATFVISMRASTAQELPAAPRSPPTPPMALDCISDPRARGRHRARAAPVSPAAQLLAGMEGQALAIGPYLEALRESPAASCTQRAAACPPCAPVLPFSSSIRSWPQKKNSYNKMKWPQQAGNCVPLTDFKMPASNNIVFLN